jgi:hypothetical protein
MKGIKKIVLPILFIGFVLYIIWATAFSKQIRCTVCVEFKGESACKSALGNSREDAMRAAIDNACAQLASGMSEIRSCNQKEPVSIEWDEASQQE